MCVLISMCNFCGVQGFGECLGRDRVGHTVFNQSDGDPGPVGGAVEVLRGLWDTGTAHRPWQAVAIDQCPVGRVGGVAGPWPQDTGRVTAASPRLSVGKLSSALWPRRPEPAGRAGPEGAGPPECMVQLKAMQCPSLVSKLSSQPACRGTQSCLPCPGFQHGARSGNLMQSSVSSTRFGPLGKAEV